MNHFTQTELENKASKVFEFIFEYHDMFVDMF